jgi:hypothetical protein
LHPDIRAAVYCGAVQRGGGTVFNDLLGMFNKEMASNSHSYFSREYMSLLEGMACATGRDNIRV